MLNDANYDDDGDDVAECYYYHDQASSFCLQHCNSSSIVVVGVVKYGSGSARKRAAREHTTALQTAMEGGAGASMGQGEGEGAGLWWPHHTTCVSYKLYTLPTPLCFWFFPGPGRREEEAAGVTLVASTPSLAPLPATPLL